jgi:hypothetical protein
MFQNWRHCHCNPPGCQYIKRDEAVPGCESLSPVGNRHQNPVTGPRDFGPPLSIDARSQRDIDDAADDVRREALMRSTRSSRP